MKDLMLDLETLGTDYESVITQIGACYFDRYSGEVGEQFKANINIEDCLRYGLKVDEGAIRFWFNQKNKSFLENTVPLKWALEEYRAFSKKAKYVWSHATFDFSMLLSVCAKLGIRPVNHYVTTRDIRTLVELADTTKDDDTPHEDAHDALADCLFQVQYCVKAFKILTKRKTLREVGYVDEQVSQSQT